MGYAEKMVADLDGDELGLAIWQAWANGLPQRQIAGHCGTNQSRVSRMLQEKVRAGEIATLAMVRIKQSLGRQSDASWVGIFRSLPRQQEAEARLMNHLLQPEQEEGISPMRRWVKQALDSTAPAVGYDAATGQEGAS
jgi:DNA-binding transcriptional regulator LsrR (DeoR family)